MTHVRNPLYPAELFTFIQKFYYQIEIPLQWPPPPISKLIIQYIHPETLYSPLGHQKFDSMGYVHTQCEHNEGHA